MVERNLYKVMFARANVSDYNYPGDICETRILDFKTEDVGYVTFALAQSIYRLKLMKLSFILAMANFAIWWSRCFRNTWLSEADGVVTTVTVCFFSMSTRTAK